MVILATILITVIFIVRVHDKFKVVEANTDKLKVVAKDSAVQSANNYATKVIATITKNLGAKGASKAIGNIPFVGTICRLQLMRLLNVELKFVKL